MLSVRSPGGKSFRDRFPNEFVRILEGINHGVPVDYMGDRTIGRFGPNLSVTDEDRPKITAVIREDVRQGKKAGPFTRPPFPVMCISPIGCVPKKSFGKTTGKIRVIHHLSYPHGGDSVNASILEEPLRLPTFGHAARIVSLFGRGALLIKLDVSAAYKQVPVRKEDWPLLGFLWEGEYYYERVLPFGLRSSCRLWDLYAAALHYFLYHHLDTKCRREVIHYVDDFLFIVEPGKEEEAKRLLEGAVALCAKLGLPLAAEKTEGPTTCLTFLGIEIDSVALEARLPQPRLAELRRLMVVWGQQSRASIRELLQADRQAAAGARATHNSLRNSRGGALRSRSVVHSARAVERGVRSLRGAVAGVGSHRTLHRCMRGWLRWTLWPRVVRGAVVPSRVG